MMIKCFISTYGTSSPNEQFDEEEEIYFVYGFR
jgi:hypothetical protein